MRRPRSTAAVVSKATTRCAIFTRKSSEEGLDQAFNSLDAQREACEAYVISQKHEGWVAIPVMYDDGGISGGTLERPALQRLLDDIKAGQVDVIVVYKVDRLTRSLADFAKIVEIFDAAGVSFISVTQQFTTTTSMGRLTLNMLLSFAQFEREVTGERIRDKIAASKKKGMWMGGNLPLGYDVHDRQLVINGAEAETIRHIYRRYVAIGSVHVLKGELDRDGIVSKRRVDRFGRATGGKSIARGALYLILQNPIYTGRIVHKDTTYLGQHKAIIDPELWETVQQRLAQNRVDRNNGVGAAAPSLLAGLIHDDAGERMTPSHANKKGRRYRYYVSHNLIRAGGNRKGPVGRRIPASDVEDLVVGRITSFLQDAGAVHEAVQLTIPDSNARQRVIEDARVLAESFNELAPDRKRAILCPLVERVIVRQNTIHVAIRPSAIAAVADDEFASADRTRAATEAAQFVLSIPARLKRVGMETKLMIDGPAGNCRREPDRGLLRIVAKAYRYREMLLAAHGKPIIALAAEAGVSGSYFSRLVKLSFLSPEIIQAIIRGRQPQELNAKYLARLAGPPTSWSDQKVLLGIT
jgi:DNA invertase Pin-like site-specific DNA recombinase